MKPLKFRLGIDLGTTSLGWAMLSLNDKGEPYAVIKAGVRIFSDSRNPKDGSSLAVTRRDARAARRRHDRLLKRKNRLMDKLIQHGFMPESKIERKALETLNPYQLRQKGLDSPLTPYEFGRAVFHLNQRRGFQSNRKTDKKDSDSGALKLAIRQVKEAISQSGSRSLGEWLYRRLEAKQPIRARYRTHAVVTEGGRVKNEMRYDLYVDRSMVEQEFEILWQSQADFFPEKFSAKAHADIHGSLFHQRPLKPVLPGRCTLIPEEHRAPLALPSSQRFRMYQEVNNLRILDAGLTDRPLTLTQRDQVIALLESSASKTFGKIRTALKISNEFNLEDAKRTLLKGNATAAILSDAMHFGDQWHAFSSEFQDEITLQLIDEENEETLIAWLIDRTSIDSEKAERIANVTLPQGYGKLSAKALAKILPALQKDVITYDAAVIAGGFAHHSNLNPSINGEPLPYLPYYGIPLTRHVNFGSGKESDPEEKRFGKIANPTVHVGLNQIRTVINALIKRYGHPQEVVVELARELKRSREQKLEDMRIQAENQKRNERFRADAAQVLGISPEAVSRRDIQKLILWSELNLSNAAERRCPYSGQQISVHMLLSEVVEIEHILPFSNTLDDTLNNKTVAMREANRIKGNRTPWEAKNDFEAKGWSFEGIQARALLMNKHKRYRFSENAMQIWDKEDKGFLARALNDTRYLSRVAKEYISLICPNNTRVIPGKMTAMLRGTFGLNRILSKGGEKNRNDHRHHAVDACVIGITDQNLLTRFSNASANARKNSLNRLITSIEPPWSNFLPHVQRAIDAIHVSHKPDHGFEGPIMEATAYGIKKDGSIRQKRNAEGESGREITNLIRIREPHQKERHGCDSNGNSLPYKGYIGGSNYCIEITEDEDGEWIGDVVTTYQAYRIAAPRGHVLPNGLALLRNPKKGLNGKKLVMRLVINDTVRMKVNDEFKYMRFTKVSASNGQMTFAPINEANADQRNRDKDDPFKFVTKYASSLKKAEASFVTISPIGKIRIR